ncbi:MAG: hypothetical protein Q9169_008545, partial [Polycauliona sp. 2 TL-2023]
YERRQCMEYMKLGLAGTSFLFSSGDFGVAGNGGRCIDPETKQYNDGSSGIFNPGFPSGCPYITSVGATQIVPNATVTAPEKACETVIFSGGGFSNVFPLPSYQASAVKSFFTNFPPPYGADRFNNSQQTRGFPDISANGANYVIAINGIFTLIYGTSASSPTVGAIFTLINEARLYAGKSTLGFANPFLYANPGALKDITLGANPGCGTAGFQAVPGWDPATGLGTPNFPKLLAAALKLPRTANGISKFYSARHPAIVPIYFPLIFEFRTTPYPSTATAMAFLGGAECSTAGNPLSQFTKHVQDDKSLQRDRLVGSGPSIQDTFRTQRNGADQEAAMQDFLQQNNHLPPEALKPFAMEQMRRDLDGYRMSSPGASSPAWATEFDPGEQSTMERAFKSSKTSSFVPQGFSPAEFQRFQQMERTQSPRMSSPSPQFNSYQRPMGMGYGMNGGMSGMGLYNPMSSHQRPMESMVQNKGKDRMVELDDKDWEQQFAEIDAAGKQEEQNMSEEDMDTLANAAMEAELGDMD